MKPKREPWYWIFWATGIVMLIAIGLFSWSIVESSKEGAHITASESPRTGGGIAPSTYQTLSRVYPPAYRDLSSATPKPAGFQTAINHYSQRDYASAISTLVTIIAEHPDYVEARLYLGICYLAANEREMGMAQLRQAIAAGDTPYLEQARFYLAKALLGTGDIAGARGQLNDVIAMHGDLEQQAETLLARLK